MTPLGKGLALTAAGFSFGVGACPGMTGFLSPLGTYSVSAIAICPIKE